MKLIKLTDDHYILVDNSEIKKGDWISFPNLKKFVPVQYLGGDLTGFEKKITESSQPIEEWKSVSYGGDGTVKKKIYNKIKELPLQEVKELLGVVDKAFERYPVIENDKDHNDRNYYRRSAYYQALEDNKDRKYTREDLLDAYTWGFLEGTERGDDVTDSVNKFSQSLQPKTEWDVEFVDGKLKLV